MDQDRLEHPSALPHHHADLGDPDNAMALAAWLFRSDNERWRHAQGVAARARLLVETVPVAKQSLLLSAAWLHDIGYAPAVLDTGFHPLDGADYLVRIGAPAGLADLVAHHSGARWVAEVLGLRERLAAYRFEITALTDALTTADQTTGPLGQSMRVDRRIQQARERHGLDSPSAQVDRWRTPYILDAVARTRSRLGDAQKPVATSSVDKRLSRSRPH